jgi:hypothetical protein
MIDADMGYFTKKTMGKQKMHVSRSWWAWTKNQDQHFYDE